MDALVEAALRKWPNVPHCHGWLALDARGNWYMRDERIQAAGPFPQVKGSRIDHPRLLSFIERNYASDEAGAWFFQNGPQRVYLELEAAPWVWRIDAGGGRLQVQSHTRRPAQVQDAWVDERGRLFLRTDLGFGGVLFSDDLEMKALTMPTGEAAIAAVTAGCDVLLVCSRADLAVEAHEALVHEAEKSTAFRTRCEEAWARGMVMRRRVPPAPLTGEEALSRVFEASGPVMAELAARWAKGAS